MLPKTYPKIKKRLINDLLKKELLTEEQINEIEILEKDSAKHFFQVLIEGDYLRTELVRELLLLHYDIASCNVMEKEISTELISRFTHEFVSKYVLMPLEVINSELIVAMANPFHISAIEALELITEYDIKPLFADSQDIKMLIYAHYSASQLDSIQLQFMNRETFLEQEENEIEREAIKNSPIVQFVDSVLDSAVLYDATDIHIEPYEDMFRVRFRIDGVLWTQKTMRLELLPNVVSRIKIISDMDISDRRLPQDGHFRISKDGDKIDYRVNTIPTVFGEKIAIRVTHNAKAIINKSSLGFFEEDLKKIENLLKNPHGAILVTGPTSSGKNTTLISFLSELNSENLNIITVENPVEKIINGVNQIEVNSKIGLGFTDVLRAVLRQDPDIMMVGEIRDFETARIAIRAALTGHLVFSTLHTNDAISTINRLLDMGIEAHLIPEAIKGIISQRLVRRICEKCKVEDVVLEETKFALNLPQNIKAFRGAGCSHCRGTGYKGRFAVYEIVSMQDHKLEHLIKKTKKGNNKFKVSHLRNGMVTLRENVLRNVQMGNTTVEEMQKVVFGSDF